MRESKRKKPLHNGLYLSLVILNACLITITIGLSQNTLDNNRHWRISKQFLAKHVMGANQFSKTGPALHQNKLHLDAWHGHQEVILNKSLFIDTVLFDLLIKQYSSAFLLFNVTSQSQDILELSPSFIKHHYAQSDKPWRLISQVKSPLLNNKWATIELKNTPSGIQILINKEPITYLKNMHIKPHTGIGFRGSLYPVTIDNIILKQQKKTLFKESFSPPFFIHIWIGACLLLGVASLFIGWLCRKRTSILTPLTLSQITLSTCIVITYFYIFFYQSGRYY